MALQITSLGIGLTFKGLQVMAWWPPKFYYVQLSGILQARVPKHYVYYRCPWYPGVCLLHSTHWFIDWTSSSSQLRRRRELRLVGVRHGPKPRWLRQLSYYVVCRHCSTGTGRVHLTDPSKGPGMEPVLAQPDQDLLDTLLTLAQELVQYTVDLPLCLEATLSTIPDLTYVMSC